MENKRIKELRLRFELSQERFARLLGVSLQTVRRWESGLTRPLPIISLKLEELQKQISNAPSKKEGVPMSEDVKKPSEGTEFGISGLFKGLGGLFDLVSKMAEEGKEEYTRSGEMEAPGGRAKAVYGFSVRMGLGGKPIIEQFGNLRATQAGPEVAEVREPLVDVLDEGDRLVVLAELPGVEEKDIRVEVKGDIVVLTAEARERKYSKEILLPAPVDAATLQTSYKNGILEIKLRKKQ